MSGTLFLLASNVGANAVIDLMEDSDTGAVPSRFIDRPSRVTVAIEATDVGFELQIFSGSRTVVPRSSLSAGGVVGIFPNVNEIGFSFFAAAGEQLQLVIRNTTATATFDIMGSIDISPIG